MLYFSMFLTDNFPDLYPLTLCIMFRNNNLVLAQFPYISANSNESKNVIIFRFPEISGNIKFLENLQPYSQYTACLATLQFFMCSPF